MSAAEEPEDRPFLLGLNGIKKESLKMLPFLMVVIYG